ncbi:MAG: T9SS type A sorting domain-containing protein [Bacteroidetes bacterium]|nr:T9SS type A sorting domain-containing protein [Bacteroidota bacterium]
MLISKSVFILSLGLLLSHPQLSNGHTVNKTNPGVGIIALRSNGSQGIPILKNATQAVSEIVTTSKDFDSSGSAFLQDEHAGVTIYSTETDTKTKTDYLSVVEDITMVSSDNFTFSFTNLNLYSASLATSLETKFDVLDKTICQVYDNIHLFDRSEKIKVFLYDVNESFAGAPADLPSWDVGYYLRDENELHIKVPSTDRQLKYFPSIEKAALSVLARYVMAKKRPDGSEPVTGLSFGFGLYESGYTPDLNLINSYLNTNNNTFPDNYSSFSTWDQLEDETNVELAYTYVFASIFRYGYFSAALYSGVCYGYAGNGSDLWYHIIRIFFLTEIEDGGLDKFYEGDDYIIYSNSQEEANLVAEGLQLFSNKLEADLGERINHPLLVTIYHDFESYTYTRNGNIDNIVGGGEALSHTLLRVTSGAPNLDTELNRVLIKHNDTMEHEFTHNVFGYMAETRPPAWLNEGAAMNTPEQRVYGYIGMNVSYFEQNHNYWHDQNLFFPDLGNVFDINTSFGYHMSYSAFGFICDNASTEELRQFMKNCDDYSTIGYSGIDEFQNHLYESLYHQYMPNFLFNPGWSLDNVFTPGTNYSFNWNGNYIENLVIEYSTNEMSTWNHVADVSFSSGSYSWNIPSAANCILRFSDKDYPEINFTYQILGEKPTFGKILFMSFENGTDNTIQNGNDGRIKGDVEFVPRDGINGNYAKYDGMWDLINVKNYTDLSLSENWTIQGDFMIENASGLMNQKPVLLEKNATSTSTKNYSIYFNKNGQKHLYFEYYLENNSVVVLEIDGAGISEGNWYTFYFARSVENNIAEARVYNQSGYLLDNAVRQINGEGKVLTGAGDLFLSSGKFSSYENCLQGGLDNIIISDTYSSGLMPNSIENAPVLVKIPDQTIVKGNSFTPIQLDDFVSDLDNAANELVWSYSGNTNLSIDINVNRVATVSVLNAQWIGSETITFTVTDPDGNSTNNEVSFTVASSTGLEINSNAIPIEFELTQNYPNPFNPGTVIRYGIPEQTDVTLRVYDVLGREVTTLINETQSVGYYEYEWNASDNASGIYFYILDAGSFREVRKMILIK